MQHYFGIINYKNIEVDYFTRKATLDNKTLDLHPMEWAILAYLLFNKGKIIRHVKIIDDIWGNGYTYKSQTDRHTLHVAVSRLRIKLDKDIIVTRRGIGYGIL